MPEIELVVFDIGETILREDRVWAKWAEWLDVTPTVFSAMLGSVISARKDLLSAFEMIKPGFDFAAELVAKEAAGLNSTVVLRTSIPMPLLASSISSNLATASRSPATSRFRSRRCWASWHFRSSSSPPRSAGAW